MYKNMGQRAGRANIERPVFYSYETLEEFGYIFNEKGELRDKQTGEKFHFEVKKFDREYNQKHYEALGEIITKHVYQLLVTTSGLKKVFVPADAKEDEGQVFFFMSDDALTADKLMILIHGSGVVRAGQWARSLIINDCLDSGTMLPYISQAQKEGYGVLITNGNENVEMKDGKSLRIRGSESPEDHFVYVWEHFISRATARDVVIVAHSYGGVVVVHAMKNCKDAMSRVKAVAFTDSVHSLSYQGASQSLRHWFKKRTRNWVSSDLPLDTAIKSPFVSSSDSRRVSAGTLEHVWTSHYAFRSVFKFFDERLSADRTSSGSKIPDDNNKSASEHTETEQPSKDKDLVTPPLEQRDKRRDRVEETKQDEEIIGEEGSEQVERLAPDGEAELAAGREHAIAKPGIPQSTEDKEERDKKRDKRDTQHEQEQSMDTA